MTDVVLTQAFCQVNTVRGWGYLDSAGQVINEYDGVFENSPVTVEGLRLLDAKSGAIAQAQVTPKMIWVSFNLPDTPQIVADQSIKFINRVADLIHVVACRRMAVRMAYMLPLDEHRIADLIKSHRLFVVPSIDGTTIKPSQFEIALTSKVPDFAKDASVNLRLSRATRSPEAPEDFPPSGLMIDFDLYRDTDKPGEIALVELRKFVPDAVRWIGTNVASIAASVGADDTHD